MAIVLSILAFVFATVVSHRANAASAEDFYKGKTLRVVVGFAAGGGFDSYARILARHMPRHIPGNPALIVDNMPGAGSRLAANYLYKASAPDGLTIGNFIGSLIMQQVLGDQSVEFDGRKFEWLGAPVTDETACAVTTASGVTNMDQWVAAKKPVKLGGEAPGANDSDVPRILRAAVGLPIQLIEGYKGTSNIRLAAEAGEVDGVAGPGRRSGRLGRKESSRARSMSSCKSMRKRLPIFPTWPMPLIMRRQTKRAS
jgi:tripartite-type tricarboxylate transporter receptor subunit TctC